MVKWGAAGRRAGDETGGAVRHGETLGGGEAGGRDCNIGGTAMLTLRVLPHRMSVRYMVAMETRRPKRSAMRSMYSWRYESFSWTTIPSRYSSAAPEISVRVSCAPLWSGGRTARPVCTKYCTHSEIVRAFGVLLYQRATSTAFMPSNTTLPTHTARVSSE